MTWWQQGRWSWRARLYGRLVCTWRGHKPIFEQITGRTTLNARVRGERVYCARCGVTLASRAEREPLPR